MKTIAVVSDSHGNRAALDNLMPLFSESGLVIHLGDTSSDGLYIKKQLGANGEKVKLLNGNCDFYRLGEDELVLEVEKVKIFCCHGDMYGVKQGLTRLAKRASELGCSVALYGHTHEANECELYGVKLFNPGCLTRYSRTSYLYLVCEGEKAVGKIVWKD